MRALCWTWRIARVEWGTHNRNPRSIRTNPLPLDPDGFPVALPEISCTPTTNFWYAHTERGVGITVVGVPEISGTVVGVPENDAGHFCRVQACLLFQHLHLRRQTFLCAMRLCVMCTQANQPRTSQAYSFHTSVFGLCTTQVSRPISAVPMSSRANSAAPIWPAGDFLSCVRRARFARMHASGLPHSLNV